MTVTETESNALAALDGFTYAILHHPACPSPFQIRLVGPRAGELDLRKDKLTRDTIVYGKTVEEAVGNALTALHEERR